VINKWYRLACNLAAYPEGPEMDDILVATAARPEACHSDETLRTSTTDANSEPTWARRTPPESLKRPEMASAKRTWAYLSKG